MKKIKALTKEEQRTLLDAARHASEPRFRQRAHAVYLCGQGYRINQLADIFAVDRDTVSGWLTDWEHYGLMGLRDQPHPGRPRRITEEALVSLEKDLKQAPHHAQLLVTRFHECTGLTMTFATIKRWLKARHWVWKRCRRSLKTKQEPVVFEEGQRVLNVLQAKETAGEIDLFYLDESGFSADACIPYAWQPLGKTLALPANTTGRVNVIGMVSRQGASYFHSVETTITSSVIEEAMTDFIRSRPANKLTMVIIDNAPVHRKAERESQATWLLGHVWVWFLPPYSPELNLIEILWKKIKYVWLSWEAYANFHALRLALQEIFQNYGTKYRVNFV
ncbi:MAG: IS630 family transposase [Methylobacter sp.]